MPEEHLFQDGTLSFLPTRLNRQPVVIGGLTADEMWITVFTSGAAGFVLGIPAALVAGNAACIPLGALPATKATLSAPSAWVSAAASCGG